MVDSRLTRALLAIGLGAGCSPQPVTKINDCGQTGPSPGATAQPRPAEEAHANVGSRGGLRDRNGTPLSGGPTSDTPASLRPWIGALASDGTGESGLQARFDSELAAGKDVEVSLDAQLHHALERAFDGVERGAGVVLRIRDGAVLALYSTLPHNTTAGVERRHWATSRPDACGSTAKPFTALAALRAGVADERTKYDCTGRLKIGNAVFSCWGKHGSSDLGRALAISDNIFFFQLARQLKHDDVADAQHAFGLGEPVRLFPEAPAGWVPHQQALEGDGQKLQQQATLTQAIGHGMAVTPLQVARAYAGHAPVRRPISRARRERPSTLWPRA